MSTFALRKASRKQNKYSNILYKETNIESSSQPTKNLFIGNAGLATGLQKETVLAACIKYGQIEDIIMIPGKSYCFVVYHDIESSTTALNALNNNTIEDYPEELYLIFSNSTPVLEKINWNMLPPGAEILQDFINESEEAMLLESINLDDENSECLKNRKVKHYGYEFQYGINNINKEQPLADQIPSQCNFLFDRLRLMGHKLENPDQLTVNQYLPGQGIPPHVDTHSACGDTILSLSLGSPVVMDFKQKKRIIPILLPQRSLLIMSGEARYAWSHGIMPRKMDIVPDPNGGLTVQNRGTRTSFTFRWTRSGECNCVYHLECDSLKEPSEKPNPLSDEVAAKLESTHVHKVYEDIANHFSETRYKPWPRVRQFVERISPGSILVDVGCGNAKNLGHNRNIFEVGCDTSWHLLNVCRERGFQVFHCNCLSIPLQDECADACLSIAVIHHLATEKRRLSALREIERVLRPGGRALIYVWAKIQKRDNKQSAYIRRTRRKPNETSDDESSASIAEAFKNQEKAAQSVHDPLAFDQEELDNIKSSMSNSENLPSLPIHTNRTQFEHQDILVPWKLKPQSTQNHQESEPPIFLRYYHVFEQGELEETCAQLTDSEVTCGYYDQGNWCVVLRKKRS